MAQTAENVSWKQVSFFHSSVDHFQTASESIWGACWLVWFFSCGEFQWWAVPEGQMLQSIKASGVPSPVGLVPLRKNVLIKWCEDWFAQADRVLKCTFTFLKAWKLKLGLQPDHRRSGCPDWVCPLLSQGINLVAASLTYWDLGEEKLLF